MKFKNVIAYYVDRRNKSSTNIDKKYPNCPTLTIADMEYLVTLGQWLGEFTNYKNSKDGRKYKYIDANYLIRKKMVTDKDLEIVTKRFANLLRMVGISEDNICCLDNFKREKLEEVSFDCYLYNTGEVINMKVTFATINNCPELIINYNGVTTEYEHWYCKHPEVDRLGIQAIYRDLNETGSRRSFFYTTHHNYHGEIIDKVNKFEIDIDYPNEYASTDMDNPYVDYDKLESLLREINFPIDFKILEDKIRTCLKMDISKYEIRLKCLCNGEALTYCFPEYVRINDCHKDLALTIGDWMEAHSPTIRSLLPSKETRKKVLNSNGIKEISRHFTEILKLAGLNVNNHCELMGFNKEDLSFECVLEDESIARIQLIMSTEDDYSHKISVEYNGNIQVFRYSKGCVDEEEVVPDKLYLDYIDKDVDSCGTRFRHDIDWHAYHGKSYDDKGRLEITLYYPGDLADYYPDNPFVDENELERIISTNCEFPIDIGYLYKRVLTCIKKNPMSVGINIKAIKYIDDKEYVTDAISCRGSYVNEFTITKRWRTITVKPDGTWNYDSAEWKVSQNINKQISYILKDIISDESKIDNCPTPADVYREAKEEAEQVRKLAKALVQPR